MELVLEYLKVILSAPVMAIIAFALFLSIFKADIKGLMHRIARIKFPGGELAVSQSEPPVEPKPAPKVPAEEPMVPSTKKLGKEQSAEFSKLLKEKEDEAELWEFRYLNEYFVPNTQTILDWFSARSGPIMFSLFNASWSPTIPSPTERETILNVLCAHRLVSREGDVLAVTPKGEEYAKWNGRTIRRASTFTGPFTRPL